MFLIPNSFFSLFQKPYACQLPGCTKRYTDPSSLRKHVKNHALRNANGHLGRRKSSSASNTNQGSKKTNAAKTRRHSESSLLQAKINKKQQIQQHQQQQQTSVGDIRSVPLSHLQQQKPRSNSCSEMVMQQDNYGNKQHLLQPLHIETQLGSVANRNSMNFNDLSNCIVTIEQHSANNQQCVTTLCGKPEVDATYNLPATASNQQRRNSSDSVISNSSNGSILSHSSSINQMPEFQQMLPASSMAANEHKTNAVSNSPAGSALTCSMLQLQNGSSNSNANTTNSISGQCHNNINQETSTIIDHHQHPNSCESSSNCNDGSEYVSFDYVKKLLSETFDCMDNDDEDTTTPSCCTDNNNQCNSCTATSTETAGKTSPSPISLTLTESVTTGPAATIGASIVVISGDKQKPTAMPTTSNEIVVNENLNNDCRKVEEDDDDAFAKHFDMDYLEGFM